MKAVRSADLSADEALVIAGALKARGLLDVGRTGAAGDYSLSAGFLGL
jgi:hypothetical protein